MEGRNGAAAVIRSGVAVDGGIGFGAVMSNGLLAPATGRAAREERFTRPKMTRC